MPTSLNHAPSLTGYEATYPGMEGYSSHNVYAMPTSLNHAPSLTGYEATYPGMEGYSSHNV